MTLLDPNSFVNFKELKDLVDSSIFNYSDQSISHLFDSVKQSSNENGDWFNLDFTTGGEFESEGKGLDQDVLYVGPGRIAVCQIYRNSLNYEDSSLHRRLFEFRSQLKSIEGIESSQFYYINNIIVLEHSDDLPNNKILRMIFPLEVPKNVDYNLLGIKINSVTIVPNNNSVIFFDHSTKHSAWNLTGQSWKFLSFDIFKEYIL